MTHSYNMTHTDFNFAKYYSWRLFFQWSVFKFALIYLDWLFLVLFERKMDDACRRRGLLAVNPVFDRFTANWWYRENALQWRKSALYRTQLSPNIFCGRIIGFYGKNWSIGYIFFCKKYQILKVKKKAKLGRSQQISISGQISGSNSCSSSS